MNSTGSFNPLLWFRTFFDMRHPFLVVEHFGSTPFANHWFNLLFDNRDENKPIYQLFLLFKQISYHSLWLMPIPKKC